MAEQHTPGPWHSIRQFATDDSHQVRTAGPGSIVIADCGRQSCDDGVIAANAHLIAAAPDLLQALTDLRDCFAPHPTDPIYAVWKRASDAIDTARGERSR